MERCLCLWYRNLRNDGCERLHEVEKAYCSMRVSALVLVCSSLNPDYTEDVRRRSLCKPCLHCHDAPEQAYVRLVIEEHLRPLMLRSRYPDPVGELLRNAQVESRTNVDKEVRTNRQGDKISLDPVRRAQADKWSNRRNRGLLYGHNGNCSLRVTLRSCPIARAVWSCWTRDRCLALRGLPADCDGNET